MFERPHQQRIEKLLHSLDGQFFQQARCFFGGGTAVSLLLGEFRESVDVDFSCSSTDGYRLLRTAVFDGTLNRLLNVPLKLLRELRTDQYGIRTFVEVDGVPIKFEIVREARIELGGEVLGELGVPVLCRDDLFAEKLLANADRVNDRATFSRDAIDLAIMVTHWGPIPVSEQAWLDSCIAAMNISSADGARVSSVLPSFLAGLKGD
jgi:Nucleotidyl transferase AbiEii toxin, Type IV TA system